MKNEIKKLYLKDPKLAKEVAQVLGYKIVKAKPDIDELLNFLSRDLFNRINEYASSKNYMFKMSADEFRKVMNGLLLKKLR